METKRSLIFKGILLALIVGVVIRQYIKYRVPPDMDMATLELVDLSNKPINLSSYQGKALFINFYATWCPPCNAEMPALETMKQTIGTDKMVYLAISDEDAGRIGKFKNEHGSSFLFVRSQKLLKDYGIHTIPTTYIVNTNGEITYDKVGGMDWAAEDNLNLIKEKAGI